ncbi:rubrerythrin [Methanolobus sp. ZRKC3]
MLSELPIDLESVSKEDMDKEIMRLAMIAELDAINFYEQMASLTDDEDMKTMLLDIAKEEMIHVLMFQTVLIEVDPVFLDCMTEYSFMKACND